LTPKLPPLPHFSSQGYGQCSCGERVPIVNVTFHDGAATTLRVCPKCDDLEYRGQ